MMVVMNDLRRALPHILLDGGKILARCGEVARLQILAQLLKFRLR